MTILKENKKVKVLINADFFKLPDVIETNKFIFTREERGHEQDTKHDWIETWGNGKRRCLGVCTGSVWEEYGN